MRRPLSVHLIPGWRRRTKRRATVPGHANLPKLWAFARKFFPIAHATKNGSGFATQILTPPARTPFLIEAPRSERRNNDQPFINIRKGCYRVRLAVDGQDRLAAYRLRFVVFNLELNEGLESAYENGCDTDEFDPFCDHLLVEHTVTGRIVGTYRLQSGSSARANLGFYSEREFAFAPYREIENSVVELGRACVHRDHRSTDVLSLLWKGIVHYALRKQARYLIGCCSLTSQDPTHGAAVYARLRDYETKPALRTVPHPAFAMPLVDASPSSEDIPKLLRTYLAVGAKICGPPAIDREFKTIDFLTLMDIEELHPRLKSRLVG